MSAAYKLQRDYRREEREVARASVYVSVDVYSDHNFWTGLTMNMSEGGLFVATHSLVPVGSFVILHMMLPSYEEEIVIAAEVRWTRAYSPGQDGTPPGIGLQFIDLDDDTLLAIREFIESREPLFFEA